MPNEIVPYARGRVRGLAQAGYESFDFASLPWDEIRSQPTPGVELVKSSETRRVLKVEWNGPRGIETLYAKRNRLRRGYRGILYWFAASKSRQEFHLGRRLFDRGIPTAMPVAFGEEKRWGLQSANYLLLRELAGVTPLQDRWAAGLDRATRWHLARAFAKFFRQAHENGFYHDDCAAEHVLAAQKSPKGTGGATGEWKFFFIDLDNGRLRNKPLRVGLRRHNFFQLWKSFPSRSLSPLDALVFLRAYYGKEYTCARARENFEAVARWMKWKPRVRRVKKILRRKVI